MKYSYGTTLLGEIQSRIKLRPAAVEVTVTEDFTIDDEGIIVEELLGEIDDDFGVVLDDGIIEELLGGIEDEGIIELLLGLVEEVVRVALDEEAMDEQGTVTVIVE